jgi:hypothetical protein
MDNVLDPMDIKEVLSLHIDSFLFNLAPLFKKKTQKLKSELAILKSENEVVKVIIQINIRII